LVHHRHPDLSNHVTVHEPSQQYQQAQSLTFDFEVLLGCQVFEVVSSVMLQTEAKERGPGKSIPTDG